MRKIMLSLLSVCALSTSAFAQIPPPPQDQPHEREGHRGQRAEMMAKLSPEGRKIIIADMQTGKAKLEASMASRKAARDKIRAAMIAEPFNAATLSTAFAEERALAATHQKDRNDHMIGMLGKLSAADRKIFAESTGRMEMRMRIIKKNRDGKVIENRVQ
jgi:uncharacterized membrane protein